MSAELDAAVRLAQEANDDCRRWAGLLQEAKAERDAALAVIEKVRKASDTSGDATASEYAIGEDARLRSLYRRALDRVDAVLATADTSALAARDAETRRRAAHEWAADADARGDIGAAHPGCPTAGDWLRALAKKGANRG